MPSQAQLHFLPCSRFSLSNISPPLVKPRPDSLALSNLSETGLVGHIPRSNGFMIATRHPIRVESLYWVFVSRDRPRQPTGRHGPSPDGLQEVLESLLAIALLHRDARHPRAKLPSTE